MKRIIVTGSREFDDRRLMRNALVQALDRVCPNGDDDVTLVHGDARGADRMAAAMVPEWGLIVEPWPANWRDHGKSAGPIRNQRMVNSGADIAVAFFVHGLPCRGTHDCVAKLEAAGIEVIRALQVRRQP